MVKCSAGEIIPGKIVPPPVSVCLSSDALCMGFSAAAAGVSTGRLLRRKWLEQGLVSTIMTFLQPDNRAEVRINVAALLRDLVENKELRPLLPALFTPPVLDQFMDVLFADQEADPRSVLYVSGRPSLPLCLTPGQLPQAPSRRQP